MNHYQKRQLAQSVAAVVGIDAGKFKHALVVRPRGGADSKPLLFETSRTGFEIAIQLILEAAPNARPEDVLVGIEFAGYYGFTLAHFLRDRGFRIVSVLPKHTKHWKEVYHNQGLKSDPADALTITDLVGQGSFVGFPFLEQVYADLRHLVSLRERLSKLRIGSITRLKDVLQVVWPEFERRLGNFAKKTPYAVLGAYPGAEAFLRAPKRKVLRLLKSVSRGQHGEALYDELVASARQTIALAGAQGILKEEIGLQLELLSTYERQIAKTEALMVEALTKAPEAIALLSIPKLGPVTAAVFLGSIGDPQAYESSRQVLRIAGLSLVVNASGTREGRPHLSKRGRPEFRRQMYMFAIRSVTVDGIFRAEFERALRANPKAPKKKILVGFARKATRMMFSLAKNRRLYCQEPPR